MGKEMVSEGLADGHAPHWIEICGEVNVISLDWLKKRFFHVPCMKCGCCNVRQR
jgi:hypothetical protein